MNDKKERGMPVFLINGFLEAGKTKFISFTLQQEYFKADETTVLLLCEEGDTEYDPKLLQETKTKVVTVDDVSELTPEFFRSIDRFPKPFVCLRVQIGKSMVFPPCSFVEAYPGL